MQQGEEAVNGQSALHSVSLLRLMMPHTVSAARIFFSCSFEIGSSIVAASYRIGEIIGMPQMEFRD